MIQTLASDVPRLAVIVPIYGHSSLVIEAVHSVLSQRYEGGLRLLLVNDGCPQSETDDVCRDYALSYPNVVTYLRKANGGLSDARNCGIRHVLEHLPSVECVYMLDADNRLHPSAMTRAVAALDADPGVDWIYPNIDMFGLEQRLDYGGDYSLLIHSAINICEAGSLIRRRVFEAGVLYDTTFRSGWEDWEFFLSAAKLGFRGKNIENFGFLYRKRPESMLANANRKERLLLEHLRQKHADLFVPRLLVSHEQHEAPRYALHIVDEERVIQCTDPVARGATTSSFKEFDERYWKAQISPGRYRTPPFTVILSRNVLDGLRDEGLLHWVLWALEKSSERSGISFFMMDPIKAERFKVSMIADDDFDEMKSHVTIVCIATNLLNEILKDRYSSWVESLTAAKSDIRGSILKISLGNASFKIPEVKRPRTIYHFLSFVHRLRASAWREAALIKWGYRSNGISYRGNEHRIVRQHCGGAAVFPRVADGRKHIGFLLPLVEFGGVEKAALQIAKAIKSYGWVPHAFVLSSSSTALSNEWVSVFESTSHLPEPCDVWGGSQAYMGTWIPHEDRPDLCGTLVGMLHWLDAVINFHSGAALTVIAQLRSMGIKTLNSIHVSDSTRWGRSFGHPYLGLAYEHAFDLFVPCSQNMCDWLHGMGVPRDKIILVRNAPGFDIDPEVTERGVAGREARGSSEPLRVLFLGRFVWQKGVDRLAECLRQSRTRRLNIIWRAIGTNVIGDDVESVDSEVASIAEPPISSPPDLAAALAWADVLLLLSRYEGLPLSVLEAVRAGAVVVAPNVGAIDEVIRNGETGFLVNDRSCINESIKILSELSQDRSRLVAVSRRAREEFSGRGWREAIDKMVRHLG